MIGPDQYLIVRAASIYITVVFTAVAWMWRRPSARAVTGAMLAGVWNLPVVLMLHLAAARFGWWTFDARGGLLLGMPVDLYLSWAWLWGATFAIAFPSLSLGVVALVAFAADLVLMPGAAPVVRLGPAWLLGEAIGVAVGVVPAQLLARWTARDDRLAGRALLQVIAFTGLVLFVLPAIVLDATGGTWSNLIERSAAQLSLLSQALAVPAVLGLSAVQEFVTRGGGTPLPFDPPRRIVTTGVYSYVGNPMQLSSVVLLVLLGLVLHNAWVAAAAVVAHVYSAGIAGWDEDEDLRHRFGEVWMDYRRQVRRWIPHFRPWHRSDHPAARLFVAESCDMCREVSRWFQRRDARHLEIVPAETHPSHALTRITYEPADGSRSAKGVEAIARALEHIHLGWALVGFFLRLPVVGQLAQLLADASGAEPRVICAGESGKLMS